MQMIRVLARRRISSRHYAALFIAVLLGVTSLQAQAAQAAETAQKLLFDTPYLQQLKLPSSLNYTYRHEAAETRLFGKPFTDTIAVDLVKPSNPDHVNRFPCASSPVNGPARSAPTWT